MPHSAVARTCAQLRAAAARRTHWLTGLLYLPVGVHFLRQGAPGWAVAADAAAYFAVMLLVLPTCMALAEVCCESAAGGAVCCGCCSV